MLSELSQVSKQSYALANISSMFPLYFGQIKHTNRCVEVLCCLDVYVGVSIMTLGVLENLEMLQFCKGIDCGMERMALFTPYTLCLLI